MYHCTEKNTSSLLADALYPWNIYSCCPPKVENRCFPDSVSVQCEGNVRPDETKFSSA